jgi:hypothetical protein
MDVTNRVVNFSIFIDGVEKTRHNYGVMVVDQSVPVQISWVEDLSSGDHTIEIRWSLNQTGGTARTNSNIWTRNVLTVLELGG